MAPLPDNRGISPSSLPGSLPSVPSSCSWKDTSARTADTMYSINHALLHTFHPTIATQSITVSPSNCGLPDQANVQLYEALLHDQNLAYSFDASKLSAPVGIAPALTIGQFPPSEHEKSSNEPNVQDTNFQVSALADASGDSQRGSGIIDSPQAPALPLDSGLPTTSQHVRREHPCIQCGKIYDRKTRARDCRLQDFGIMPYQCAGRCERDDSHAPIAAKFTALRSSGAGI
ncbi:hypothetical protein M408DRAFT_25956 [Serendipita vermifera MAFF 305830]|uniref:C2H2-type domain-containing protein n=1 Tax=Serendipita vermifera MAFF 305830 TaxID=933852 RepID=A0A0C2WHH0_SERVB|nr:hypothetical protein M408DRAFT_25956 [Serendipita vermifera MAFF 305830]